MNVAEQLLLVFALAAAFLVHIVMASQFESLVQPFLIMMTCRSLAIGVVGAVARPIPVTIMVFLGLIIPWASAEQRAIVLIDYIIARSPGHGQAPRRSSRRARCLRPTS